METKRIRVFKNNGKCYLIPENGNGIIEIPIAEYESAIQFNTNLLRA